MPLNDRYNLEEIRAYWTDQALEHGQSPTASWSDRMVIDMEIREISKHLASGDRVLDLGCANGYSTLQFAQHRDITIRGLDYIPEMVAQARVRLKQIPVDAASRTSFDIGDITAIGEPDLTYDKVVVIRVVINLGTWDRQVQALRECARVLKPGGLLLLSEASVQGWETLNNFRKEWGLPDIPMPAFNLYLDQDRVIEATKDLFEAVDLVNFASTYYVGTRVLKPLLARLTGGAVDAGNPDMHWNRWFADLPAAGDYGTQKLFILRKR